MTIGDPGAGTEFDFSVYARGAMTLQALRNQVGDDAFFRILQRWFRNNAGGNVTTAQFIDLAERISGQQLDDLFETWLYTPSKPVLATAFARSSLAAGSAFGSASVVVRSELARYGRDLFARLGR